jgi:hypothetical protein
MNNEAKLYIPHGASKVIFDDFSGESLDESIWWPPYSGVPGGTTGRFLPSHVKVSGSVLGLNAYQDAQGDDPNSNNWAGAGIMLQQQLFPGASVYVKSLQKNILSGVACIALLIGPKNWPPEIDFYETTPNANNELGGFAVTAHYGKSNSTIQKRSPFTNQSNEFESWNVWGVLWKKDSVLFSLNGIVYATIPFPVLNGPDALYDLSQGMQLALQIQTGDPNVPGNNPSITPANPVSYEIDWVLVTQQ